MRIIILYSSFIKNLDLDRLGIHFFNSKGFETIILNVTKLVNKKYFLQASKHIDIQHEVFVNDYNHFNANNNLGQRKAFDDFKKSSNFVYEKFFTYEYVGQSFLVVDVKK